MSVIEGWMGGAGSQSPVDVFLRLMYQIVVPPFLQPHAHAHRHAASLAQSALNTLEGMVHTLVWFLVIGCVIYALSIRRPGRRSLAHFTYPQSIGELGERFSLKSALKYLLPPAVYRNSSFRVDMFWLPFSIMLNFFGLLGLAVGAGVVPGWLQQHLGHSPLHMPDNGFTIALAVVIVLLARDFGHYMWHYQGHSIAFFWEFHKGHHSAEVLHPFHVRTHPVDMFIRNTYMGVGGGIIGGAVIYLLGMSYGVTAAAWVAGVAAFFDMMQMLEHSHVRLSFGKALERHLYAPYMHHFHHGAGPEHMNVNLGLTGGVVWWDRLFGTLHVPQPGEQVIWGASLQELGENNPHRTLWGFFFGPFVEAYKVLRRRSSPEIGQPSADAAGQVSAAPAGTTTA